MNVWVDVTGYPPDQFCLGNGMGLAGYPFPSDLSQVSYGVILNTVPPLFRPPRRVVP